VCGPDGVAVFDALHRRGTVTEAMLYAFDLLELDGEDLRHIPVLDRKRRLARLLSGRRLGIVLSDHTDEDSFCRPARWASRVLSRSGCGRRTGQAHRGTGSNPDSPAMVRHREERW
jgi:hypothetical protein